MAQRLPFFYGWVVVGTITTLLMATNGARLLFGVVLKPISEEYGWERSALTGAVLVHTIVLSLMQPFVGLLADRWGARRVMVVGTTLIGLTLVPLSFASGLWQFYAIYGVLGGIAFTAASPVNSATLVNRWFAKRRGTALSIATAGAPIGQLLIVPIAALILTATDWRTTYFVLAIFVLLMVPIGAWLLRDDPADIGETPDGRPIRSEREGEDAASARAGDSAPGIADGPTTSLRDALASSGFWLLAYGFIVCGFTMAFANTHFLAYADDMGMHTSVATTAISVTAIFSVIGTIVLGMLADRWDRPTVLALTYALRGVAFMLLYAFETGPLVYVYAVVLGVSWSATTPLTAAIAADIYGRRNLGVIFGTMFTAMNLGFGIGSFFDGLVYDAVGEYHPALVINGLVGLSAAAALYLFGSNRSVRLQPAPAGERSAAPVAGD